MNDDIRPKDLPPLAGYEQSNNSLIERIKELESFISTSRIQAVERERLLSEQRSIIDILRREIIDLKKTDRQKGYPKI